MLGSVDCFSNHVFPLPFSSMENFLSFNIKVFLNKLGESKMKEYKRNTPENMSPCFDIANASTLCYIISLPC